MSLNLSKHDRDIVIETAMSYLEHPYSKEIFNCVTFVRAVYKSADIDIPLLNPGPPAFELNISRWQCDDPPVGHMIFLKDPLDPRKERAWTHIVIALENKTCIHCSLFFGRKVVISTLDEIFARYEFAESKPAF
ncbi:MAG: hypothetical protein JWM20_110 [Patescibacteria group bacterium]|nr:hypothetical protein [Patescibacteria group bacterium]